MTHIESKISDADLSIFVFHHMPPSVAFSRFREADSVFVVKDGVIERIKDRGLEPTDDTPVIITAKRLRELEAAEYMYGEEHGYDVGDEHEHETPEDFGRIDE